MDEKIYLEEILCYEKSLCGIYMHFTIESSTEKIYEESKDCLNNIFDNQHKLFKLMETMGIYNPAKADYLKIETLANKYSTSKN